ncbi:MAG: hypothetical protein JST89_19835 [Cyanobacteria bacterium SZAS-4]|nr:hypothetical protein [Cyanobacteria bacterium SZAS-4]
MRNSRVLSSLLLAALLSGLSAGNVGAQIGGSSSSSSSSSTTTEATVKGYAFKYKQRFDTYSGQIEMGVTKGWLTAAQAETFKTRLAELRSVEAAAGQAGYPDAEIAKLDKLTTKFNEDLSSASSKPAATTSSATDAAASGEAKPAATKTTAKQTTAKTTTKKTTTKKTK